MTVAGTVYTAVEGVNLWHVGVSVIAQQIFACLWFGCIVKAIWEYYIAADKGVRRREHMVHRYSHILCNLMTMAAAAGRTVTISAMVSVLKGNTLADYQFIALLVAAISCINQHCFFWGQRPIPLFLTECGYELAAALLAGVTCFGLKQYGF